MALVSSKTGQLDPGMATAEDDEYEYYDEEYEYDENDPNWYYDEESQSLTSPPKNVLEILSNTYSQQLFVDVADSKEEEEDVPRAPPPPQTTPWPLSLNKSNLDSFSAQRGRGMSRQRTVNINGGAMNNKTQATQSANMMAINVIKGLFKHQTLSQLPSPLNPEQLESIGVVLENIIATKPSIPAFIIDLFGTSINNMFGVLNIDFDLLNNDYLYVKSVFVLHGESDNSSINFERIMKLITAAKIDTIQISNAHLTSASFDCIINYIANDDNYNAENYLQNSVNQIILHRKSGLTFTQSADVYREQFGACGWEMSYDEKKQHVIITLNIKGTWDYYQEDYDDDGFQYEYDDEYEYYYEDEDGQNVVQQNNGNTAVTAPALIKKSTIIDSGIGSPKMQSNNALLSLDPYANMQNDLGLPEPIRSDDESKNIDALEKKFKFLSEVLNQDVLFYGFLAEIMQAMARLDVNKGQCIMKETEYGQNYDLKFFVIEYGVFNLYQRGKKLPLELCGGSTFGESHLVYGIPQYVTIRAMTNKCCVWFIKRSDYVRIRWQYFHQSFRNKLATKVNEFEVITTLGAGSFGRVLLVRDPYGKKKTYSLKKVAKNAVIQNEQQQHIMNERSVLAIVSKKKRNKKHKHAHKQHTFCCKLYGLYQDQFYLYFLMEPLLGGELFTLLRHNKVFSESIARFYLSCVIVAFEHLHSLNIIYRDIKPENIMLSSNGYAKLVDFGFAKLRNHTVTLCGTPEYLAPEVIQNYWQGFEIDYWGLGILLYEMVVGEPPFDSYQAILTKPVPKIKKVGNKKKPTKPLVQLIESLLVKNPYQRLGTRYNEKNGVDDIYKHEWFKGKMEWSALKTQRFRPPYIPDINGDDDATNFEEVADTKKYKEDKRKNETLHNDPKLYQWCQYF